MLPPRVAVAVYQPNTFPGECLTLGAVPRGTGNALLSPNREGMRQKGNPLPKAVSQRSPYLNKYRTATTW